MILGLSILFFPPPRRYALLSLVLSVGGFAQSAPGPSTDPGELVRKAVQNEISASNDGGVRFMFRGTKFTPKGSTTKIYVETHEATAGIIVAYDGKPLTPQQRQEEEVRIDRFVKNSEEMSRKRAQEHDEAERTMRMVRALPDAFVYEYVGQETASPGIGQAGEPLLKLKFHPNPHYRPPSRVEEVLVGMQGNLLLDQTHGRLAAIDGTLFREVSFGWGILGHLDRGGHFVVHQQNVGDNIWEISSMTLKFTGKVLLFKGLFLDSTEAFSNFKRVPADLTFAQAVELLKKQAASQAAETASSRGESGSRR